MTTPDRPPPLDPARVAECKGVYVAPGCTLHCEGCGQHRTLAADLAAARDKADAGERFKAFVHSYLDSHGVPHGDPTNQHQIEGCRIGARLDLLFAERDAARKKLAELEEYIASTHDHDD